MKTINPEPKTFSKLFASLPKDQPVVMLNLLKFRELANYENGEAPCSGREAYKKYSEQAIGHIKNMGGSLLWMGDAKMSVIAPTEEEWDEVLLVRYPSVEHFIQMVTNPEYQQLTQHRTAALEDSRLIATVETYSSQ